MNLLDCFKMDIAKRESDQLAHPARDVQNVKVYQNPNLEGQRKNLSEQWVIDDIIRHSIYESTQKQSEPYSDSLSQKDIQRMVQGTSKTDIPNLQIEEMQ